MWSSDLRASFPFLPYSVSVMISFLAVLPSCRGPFGIPASSWVWVLPSPGTVQSSEHRPKLMVSRLWRRLLRVESCHSTWLFPKVFALTSSMILSQEPFLLCWLSNVFVYFLLLLFYSALKCFSLVVVRVSACSVCQNKIQVRAAL